MEIRAPSSPHPFFGLTESKAFDLLKPSFSNTNPEGI